MKNKSPSIFIMFFLFLWVVNSHAQNDSAYDHKLLGKCFGSAKEFISSAYGNVSDVDSNIEIQNSQIAGNPVTWIFDKTPTTNYQWFLLEKLKGQSCLRLYVPAASLVDEIPKHKNVKLNSLRFRAYIGPGPGFPAKKIIFNYSKIRHAFWPEECTGTWFDDDGKEKYSKPIPCENIYD